MEDAAAMAVNSCGDNIFIRSVIYRAHKPPYQMEIHLHSNVYRLPACTLLVKYFINKDDRWHTFTGQAGRGSRNEAG